MGVPARVSRYLKLALEAPLAIVTKLMTVVPSVARKPPPEDVVLRVTASIPPGVVALLNSCSRSIVIVLETTPAVSVWAPVVKRSLDAAAGLTVIEIGRASCRERVERVVGA